jgi:uncharacterized Zn finger protein (UPF0148 family)
LSTLEKANFQEEWHGDAGDMTKERVFFFSVSDDMRVAVYTTIVGDDAWAECRDVGKDAIRVCAVYRRKDGNERGVGKQTRVNRVGEVDAIAGRMLDRMRAAWKVAKRPNRCPDCGAPMFISKKGNEVCAELCWQNRSQATQAARQTVPTSTPGTPPCDCCGGPTFVSKRGNVVCRAYCWKNG